LALPSSPIFVVYDSYDETGENVRLLASFLRQLRYRIGNSAQKIAGATVLHYVRLRTDAALSSDSSSRSMTANPDHTSRWTRYRPVLQFLAKAVAIYGAWYVLYDLWLLPDGRLDAWVSRTAAQIGELVLNLLRIDAASNGRIISVAGASGVKIINGCNGLTTIGTFAGFVLAYPGSAFRRFLFIPSGIIMIYGVNVIRVSILAASQVYSPDVFSWLHGMPTGVPFHLAVFGLWVLWAHYGGSVQSLDTQATNLEMQSA